MKRKELWMGGALLGMGILAFAWYKNSRQTNWEVVQHLDADRYLGKWYEIARLDFFFERNLDHTTAKYSKNADGSIEVRNRGYNYKTGKWKESVGRAKLAGTSGEGALRVSFFGPFYSPYNIIALDPEYRYALVAGKNTDYLWILSRDILLPDSVKAEFLHKAAALGFPVDQLIWVSHD